MTYEIRFIRHTVYCNDRQKLLTNSLALAVSSTYATIYRRVVLLYRQTSLYMHFSNWVPFSLFLFYPRPIKLTVPWEKVEKEWLTCR